MERVGFGDAVRERFGGRGVDESFVGKEER